MLPADLNLRDDVTQLRIREAHSNAVALSNGGICDTRFCYIAAMQIGKLLHSYEYLSDAEIWYRIAHYYDPGAYQSGYLLGYVMLIQDRFSSAKKQFELLHKNFPENAIIAHHLGDIARHSNRTESAQSWYEKANQRSPELGGPRLQLAKIYLQKNRHEEAIALLKSLRTDFPGAVDVINTLMLAYRQMGDMENLENIASELEAMYGVTSTTFTVDPIISRVRGMRQDIWSESYAFHRAIAVGNWHKARQHIQKMMQFKPENAHYKMHYAVTLWNTGEHKLALNIMEDLIKAESTTDRIMNTYNTMQQQLTRR